MRLLLRPDTDILFSGGDNMGQKEKLIKKLKSSPKTFTFEDAETLLGYLSYYRSEAGKTGGSRVKFKSDKFNTKIFLQKPHPRKELIEYQIKYLIEQLEKEKLI